MSKYYVFLGIIIFSLSVYFYLYRGVNIYRLNREIVQWSEIDKDVQERLMRIGGGVIDVDNDINLPVKSTAIEFITPGISSFYYNGRRFYCKESESEDHAPMVFKSNYIYVRNRNRTDKVILFEPIPEVMAQFDYTRFTIK